MPKSKGSYTIATRGVRTLATLEKANLAAFVKEAGLKPETVKQIQKRLDEAQKWVSSDKERMIEFERAPLATLFKVFPDLRDKLPKQILPGIDDEQLNSACSHAPSGAYNACAMEILQRVAAWLAWSSANRDDYARDVAIAVDAVAGAAPIEAVALAKNALQHARRAH